jgi:hypothetical protein
MNDIDLGDDDGFLRLTIAGVEQQLDLWQVHARIAAYHQQHKTAPDETYHEGLVGLIEDLGYPRVSHRLAQRFVQTILAAVTDQKKTPSAPADSPASTESTPPF